MNAKDIVDNGISNGKIIQSSHIDNLYQKLFLSTVIIADYIVTDDYGKIFCDATTASLTATLPDAETNFNDTVIFKKIDSTANTITIKDVNDNTVTILNNLNDTVKCHSYLNDGIYSWIISESEVRPYKSYIAILNQSGTGVPVATIVDNTLGGEIVWSRSTTGNYLGIFDGTFTTNKAVVFIGLGAFHENPGNFIYTQIGNVSITIITLNNTGNFADGLLFYTHIEIRSYP